MSNTATFVEIKNPFDWQKNCEIHAGPAGITIREWLEAKYGPDFVDFERPTLCYYCGTPLMRADWATTKVKPGDVTQFVTVAGEAVTITMIIIAVVVAVVAVVVLMLVVPQPQVPGDGQTGDPVFTRQGQYNRLRLGEAIEVPYGRNKLWPSFAARPYNQYIGNEQYQFNLFCLGQGWYDQENAEFFVEDTPMGSFKEIEYQWVNPGEKVTLFPDNVHTAVEVSNIELFGPNQAEYEENDGWAGGFVLNEANTETTRIEFDFVYSNGLFKSNDSGKPTNYSVTYEVQLRKIDAITGDPIGDWVSMGTFTDTRRTPTPQRITRSFEVEAGRYEGRSRRTSNKSTSLKVQSTLLWQSARAFMPSVQDYGNVTMLAIKALASNNLNDNSRSRFAVVTTRMLPKWDPEQVKWTDEEVVAPEGLFATRNPIWAFCDALRAEYGAAIDTAALDLDVLLDLADYFETNDICFDWIFDQKITTWDAVKPIAQVGRGVPMLTGSRFSIIRDEPKSIPTAMFSPDNIVADSFRQERKLFGYNDYDSVRVKYTDGATWKEEQVLCALPGSTRDNPKDVTLVGCTDRQRAYSEGMYMAGVQQLRRRQYRFRTGMEGHIPAYGDLIALAHDQFLALGAFSGLVLSIIDDPDGPGSVIQLSESVAFADPEQELEENPDDRDRVLVIRKKDGSASAPYVVTAGSKSTEVITEVPVSEELFFDNAHERPIYHFGVFDRQHVLATVVSLRPSDGEEVEVGCVNYDARVHSFDGLTAPPLSVPNLPPIVPALPVVGALNVTTVADTTEAAIISWQPAYGAKFYTVELSYDGENWESLGSTTVTSMQVYVTPGEVWFRVAAINLGAGPWSEWEGELGIATVLPSIPTGFELVAAWTGTTFTLQWELSANSVGYRVRIYDVLGGSLAREEQVEGNTSFTYTHDMAVEDGMVQATYHCEVFGVNTLGSSNHAHLDVSNPAPAAPGTLSSTLNSGEIWNLNWGAVSAPDLGGYRVYASHTDGFTPSPANRIYEGPLLTTTFDTDNTTTYWIVEAYDVWGNYTRTAQQTRTLP